MFQKLINTSIALGVGTILFGQGIQFSEKNWEDILAQAKAENKMVFLDAYTTWCGPCKAMSAKIFPQAEVGEFFNGNFINAKIDMEKGEGLTLAERYSVKAYPTLLFIDGEGDVVHTILGSMSARDLIDAGTTALNPLTSTKGLREQYLENPDNRDITLKYIKVLIDSDSDDLEEVGVKYLRGEKDWYLMENEDLIVSLVQIENPEIRQAILKDWTNYQSKKTHFSLEFQADFPYTIGTMEIFFNVDKFNDKAVFDELALMLSDGEKNKTYDGLFTFYLSETEAYKELMLYFRKMSKKYTTNDDLVPIAYGMADHGTAKKDLKYAMKIVNKILKTEPEHQYARYTKVILLKKLDKEKEAKEIWEVLEKELN